MPAPGALWGSRPSLPLLCSRDSPPLRGALWPPALLRTFFFPRLPAVHETIRVKSAVWDENGVLLFTTLNHLKYCLPNGDSGVVKTLDSPLYLSKAAGGQVVALDREARVRVMPLDPTEYLFKLALMLGKNDQVMDIVRREGSLCGQSIISYLQGKGYPDVALHFVQDDRTRFNLAIDCGNIDIALQCAQSLDDDTTWHK